MKSLAFLIYFLVLSSCAAFFGSPGSLRPQPQFNVKSQEAVKQDFFISLSKIDQNPDFVKANDSYLLTSGDYKINLMRRQFSKKKEAMAFLISRRTYLHQAYSTLIAPYFGVVQADPSCMKLVDVAGELKSKNDADVVEMRFVANKNEALIDCYSEPPENTVKYFLYLCGAQNTVYEIKAINPIGKPEPSVNITCS